MNDVKSEYPTKDKTKEMWEAFDKAMIRGYWMSFGGAVLSERKPEVSVGGDSAERQLSAAQPIQAHDANTGYGQMPCKYGFQQL